MISKEGNFGNLKVDELLRKHFKELRKVSPPGSTHVLDIIGLKDKTIKFWSLWLKDQLLGCGALKLLGNEEGELKSIRVSDDFRGKGYGEKIIQHLVEESKKLEIKTIKVETGSGEFFKPARNLFKKCGFKSCEPFAHYKNDPNSCYMKLNIDIN